ncbi:TRAP transporter small permease [Comamonas aquatica]|uniref:TRAP transporter small permease n=1 Tax=Comamonas aquatica TaxID=225991 RepID=UPI00244D1510|nr:TRAP transporter small permease [Comamonas aquatica]MDH1675963.1 TRAP transporter small permease [Comamonas aquatica]MDH1679579.1 TRAP transporter small permease [Comamonas aquatica]
MADHRQRDISHPIHPAPEAPADGKLSGRSIETHIGAFVLIALVLITLVNVVVRYFTDQSFAWTEEISVFLLLALTLAGSAVASARDGHIRIEFFYERTTPQVRRLLIWLSMFCTLTVFLLLTVLMVRAGWQEFTFNETTTGLGVPRWWYTVWLPPLALFMVVRTWLAGIRQLKSSRTLYSSSQEEVL